MKQLLFLSTAILLTACGDGKKEAAERMAQTEVAPPSGLVVDLAPHDVPFTLDLGDPGTLGTDSAEVRFNEEFGWVEVRAGERCAMIIVEEPADLARLKADLDRDMLQKHTVITETPELIVYRSQFPDSDLVYVHFLRVVNVAGRTFIVQDAQGPRFTEADVERMSAAVRIPTNA